MCILFRRNVSVNKNQLINKNSKIYYENIWLQGSLARLRNIYMGIVTILILWNQLLIVLRS